MQRLVEIQGQEYDTSKSGSLTMVVHGYLDNILVRNYDKPRDSLGRESRVVSQRHPSTEPTMDDSTLLIRVTAWPGKWPSTTNGEACWGRMNRNCIFFPLPW